MLVCCPVSVGVPCGSCSTGRAAESVDALEAYSCASCVQKNEGCRLWGDVQVAKVQGSMQIAPGKAYEHLGRVLHDMTPLRNTRLDISHTVADLSFGSAYPGQINPLQGQVFDQRKKDKGNPLQQTGARTADLTVLRCAAFVDS